MARKLKPVHFDLAGAKARRRQREQSIDIAALLTSIADRLDAFEEAHNSLAGQVEELFFRTMFTMQRTMAKEDRPAGAILKPGESLHVVKTLYEFYLRDRDTFIATIKESMREVQSQLAAQIAGTDTRPKSLADLDRRRDPVLDPARVQTPGIVRPA